MIGAILTQNTNWKNVEKALANFENNLVPVSVESLDEDILKEKIRPSGFYNQKSKRIIRITNWFKRYEFDIYKVKRKSIKDLRKELIEIKGIGKETADSILLFGLDLPIMVVDAYTKRLLFRLGFNFPNKYDELRLLIENEFYQCDDLVKIYKNFHGLIVNHCKYLCTKKPNCKDCFLSNQCKKKLT